MLIRRHSRRTNIVYILVRNENSARRTAVTCIHDKAKLCMWKQSTRPARAQHGHAWADV